MIHGDDVMMKTARDPCQSGHVPEESWEIPNNKELLSTKQQTWYATSNPVIENFALFEIAIELGHAKRLLNN